MKKLIFGMMCALAATVFGGAEDHITLTFYSSGNKPDTYMDGSPVLENEFYALVWSPVQGTVPQFAADGSVLNTKDCKVVTLGPWAYNGHCDKMSYGMSDAEAASYAGGYFQLCLLDTRNADNTASTPNVVQVDGKNKKVPSAVNGYKAVVEESMLAAATSGTLSIPSPIVVNTVSALPADVPQPVITKVQMVKDAKGVQQMEITVKCTAAYLCYNVAGGATPSTVGNDKVAEEAKNGASNQETEITFRVPATEKRQFFKVIRN